MKFTLLLRSAIGGNSGGVLSVALEELSKKKHNPDDVIGVRRYQVALWSLKGPAFWWLFIKTDFLLLFLSLVNSQFYGSATINTLSAPLTTWNQTKS